MHNIEDIAGREVLSDSNFGDSVSSEPSFDSPVSPPFCAAASTSADNVAYEERPVASLYTESSISHSLEG